MVAYTDWKTFSFRRVEARSSSSSVRALDLAHGLDQAALGGKLRPRLPAIAGQSLEGRVEQVVAFKGETRQAETVDQLFEQGEQAAGVQLRSGRAAPRPRPGG